MDRGEIERIVRMARAYAAEQIPWLAPALYAARLVLTESCPALAAVDEGMRVYFNPHMVAELVREKGEWGEAMPELGFVWFHEITHRLREHAERAREKEARARLWSIACDLEINDARLPGLMHPKRFAPLLPSQFNLPEGKLAEFYYDQLQERNRLPSDSGSGEQEGAVDDQASEPEQSSSKNFVTQHPSSGDRTPESKQSEGKLPSAFDDGSGVHGEKRPWELAEDDARAPALSAVEQEVVRRSVAEQIVRQKDRGDIPAGWIRWAEEKLAPKVDWRQLFKRRMRGAIVRGTGQRVDYSFDRPHRRAFAYAPIFPPSLRGDFLPRIACVVDTSGSISERELGQALAEVRAVLESLRTPITVIPCDAVPYEPIEVFTRSDFLSRCRELPGGGGTNMVAGIEAALNLQPMPDVVLVLTDGYTPYPPRPYRVPVLFGVFTKRRGFDPPLPPIPPWRREDVVLIEIAE